jgi:predicted dehydrogenase
MVGFNRRFSPLVRQMKTLLAARAAPVAMVYNVNAGMIPMDHWSQSKAEGGGRIVGEACHFIDTLRFLAGSAIKQVDAYYARPDGVVIGDLASIHLSFHDGSIGTVHYFGNGNKDMFREGLDLYCGGGILRMQNFKSLAGFGWPGFKKTKLRRQDKGHAQEITEFLNAMKTGADTPLPLEEIFEVTAASFAANDAQ